MFGSAAAGASTSHKRKTDTGQLKFTFREAKKVKRTNDRRSGGGGGRIAPAVRKKELEDERLAGETKRLLTRLGVGTREQDDYITLSETCGIGKQELNKHSVRLLFGDDETLDAAHRTHGRVGFFTDYDDDEDYDAAGSGGRGGGERGGFAGRNITGAGGRFLKKTDDSNAPASGGRGVKTDLGTNSVYFLTLAVGTSAATGTNDWRKPNTVYLCLPPRTGTGHNTTRVNQDRLADLAIMKLYFVASYVYKTLREEVEFLAGTDNRGQERRRYPVLVIRQQISTRADIGIGGGGTWYKLLKEKLARAEDLYARKLSLDYYCNVI